MITGRVFIDCSERLTLAFAVRLLIVFEHDVSSNTLNQGRNGFEWMARTIKIEVMTSTTSGVLGDELTYQGHVRSYSVQFICLRCRTFCWCDLMIALSQICW